MKKLFLLCAMLISLKSIAQKPSTFYGLARNNTPNNEIFLANIQPSLGLVTNISNISISPLYNLTGAALDPYNNFYYFIGIKVLNKIDLISGLKIDSLVISNPLGDSYFDNFRFNNSDTSLYGLARRAFYDTITMANSGEIFLATINTLTGVISQISTSSLGNNYTLAGSAIDPYQMVYYYSAGSKLIGIDMYNGNVFSNPQVSISGEGLFFDNFTYSCADTTIYGLIRSNYYSTIYDSLIMDSVQQLDSTGIHLGKIDPNTGVVTTISPYPIAQGGYSLNASSTIDPDTRIYYYNNGSELVGVSLFTGLIVSKNAIINNNGQYFDLMRNQSNCFEATTPKRKNSTVSVPTIKNESLSIVYPNPVINELNIESSAFIKSIDLMTITGVLLLHVEPNSKKHLINITDLENGVYFIKYKTNGKTFIRKIVKQSSN